MLPPDVYRQPTAADPVLDESTVLDIARRHGVSCSALTSVDESGGEARVYGLDDTLVLKMQRPHRQRSRTNLAKEAFFLQQLSAHPEIVVPQVRGYGKYDDIEYLVMTRMPGVAACTVALTGAPRQNLLSQLGRTLRRLHALPQAPFYGNALFPGQRTWEGFMQRIQASLAQAVHVIGDTPNLWQLSVSPETLATHALAALPASGDLVTLHSNPGPVHTFIQPDTYEFVGMIDFGDAYISHPALDWRWPTHADRIALLHGYCDETPATETLLATWQAVFVYSDMVLLATRPEMRLQALERLRDLCHDLA